MLLEELAAVELLDAQAQPQRRWISAAPRVLAAAGAVARRAGRNISSLDSSRSSSRSILCITSLLIVPSFRSSSNARR